MPSNELKTQVEQEGFAIIPICLDEATVELLCKQFDETRYPERNLLAFPDVQTVATSKRVREIMESIIGSECFCGQGNFLQ